MALVACAVGIVGAFWPRVLAWPLAVLAIWSGLAWAAKGVSLRRRRPSGPRVEQLADAMPGGVELPEEKSKGDGALQRPTGDTRDRIVTR
jgi:hypothetical protein